MPCLCLLLYNVQHCFTNIITFDPHSIPERKARKKFYRMYFINLLNCHPQHNHFLYLSHTPFLCILYFGRLQSQTMDNRYYCLLQWRYYVILVCKNMKETKFQVFQLVKENLCYTQFIFYHADIQKKKS